MLAAEAVALEKAGADFIILASNTVHMAADRIIKAIRIPFLHLADATADEITKREMTSVGLLGTVYTMELDFYKDRLKAHGIQAIVPDEADRKIVSDIIYDELCHGIIKQDSREAYRKIMAGLIGKGAQGIILGCTEITTLVDQADSAVPLFDTTKIHIECALKKSMA